MSKVMEVDEATTAKGSKTLLDYLTLASLHAQNRYRADEGKPPLTAEQQVKLYGRVVSVRNG